MDSARSETRGTEGRWSVSTTALLIALVALLFAYFVWPTPWQYLSHQFLATRVHRATGHAQVLTGDGWRAVQADYVDGWSEEAKQQLGHMRLEREARNRVEAKRRRQARQGGTRPAGSGRSQPEGDSQALAPEVVAPLKPEVDESGPGRS